MFTFVPSLIPTEPQSELEVIKTLQQWQEYIKILKELTAFLDQPNLTILDRENQIKSIRIIEKVLKQKNDNLKS